MIIIRTLNDTQVIAHVTVGTTVIKSLILNKNERHVWQKLVNAVNEGDETVSSTKLSAYAE